MGERSWERLAAASGIGFFVLGIASMALGVGDRPQFGSSAESVVAFWSGRGYRVQIVYLILGVALLLFLWFVGSLRAAIARVEGGAGRLAATCFAGGIGTFVGLLFADAFSVAPAMVNLQGAPPEVAMAFSGLAGTASDTIFILTSFPKAVLIGAAGLASVRFRALPSWFGWLSLVVATVTVIGGAGITERIGEQGIMEGFLIASFIAFVFWVLIASILLTIRAANVEVQSRQLS